MEKNYFDDKIESSKREALETAFNESIKRDEDEQKWRDRQQRIFDGEEVEELDENDISNQSFTSIICMNLNEKKYYVYTMAGILANRFYYGAVQVEDLTISDLEAEVTSADGSKFLFTYKERPYHFYILTMSIFEFEFVEMVDLYTYFIN